MPVLRSHMKELREQTYTLQLHAISCWPSRCVDWAAAMNTRASHEILKTPSHLVNHKDDYGNTPLHKAVWEVDVVQLLLLLRAGANPNNIDLKGNTALHITCINLNRTTDLAKMISILLVFGADTDALNTEGHTASMYIHKMDWPMGQTQYHTFEAVRGEMIQLAQGD